MPPLNAQRITACAVFRNALYLAFSPACGGRAGRAPGATRRLFRSSHSSLPCPTCHAAHSAARIRRYSLFATAALTPPCLHCLHAPPALTSMRAPGGRRASDRHGLADVRTICRSWRASPLDASPRVAADARLARLYAITFGRRCRSTAACCRLLWHAICLLRGLSRLTCQIVAWWRGHERWAGARNQWKSAV